MNACGWCGGPHYSFQCRGKRHHPRIGSLFSGYGGLEQGVQSVLGGTVAWHSEIDPGACKILAHRYPDVPNLGDITTVDWASVEPVDVLTGGSPCQDVSAAGKRAGMRAGTRSGLWASMCDAIDIIRPGLVVWENVRGVLSAHADSAVEPCPICVGDERDAHLRALGRVVGDLAELGYVGRWTGLRAADVGAPHGRYRVFVAAWPNGDAARKPGNGTGGATRGQATEPREPDRADGGQGTGRIAPAGRTYCRTADALVPIYPDGVCDWCGQPHAVAHSDRLGHERTRRARDGRRGSTDGGVSLADPQGDGWHEGRTEPARVCGGPDAPLGRDAAPHPNSDGFGRLEELHGEARAGREGSRHGHDADRLAVAAGGVDWGRYGPAVHRWERILGRVAPSPTERGKNGQPRLSPAFVEWLMGLPVGWVTDVPGITRNEALKALGNGVVPQQAAAALRLLLPDVGSAAA